MVRADTNQGWISKDYDKVDEIRSRLKEEGVVLKDMKSGIDWAYEEA